jgi:hypothetical protein
MAQPKIATLIDNFAVNDLATVWNGSSAGVSIGGLQASVPCVASYDALFSTTTYDLTGSSVFCQAVPSQGADREGFLEADVDGSNYVQMGYSAGTLFAKIETAGSATFTQSTTYDPVAHAWWRIREATGTIFFDTAPDGHTWTNRWSSAYTITITAVSAAFVSGFFSTDVPTTSFVRAFNVAPGSAVVSPGAVLIGAAPASGSARVAAQVTITTGAVPVYLGGPGVTSANGAQVPASSARPVVLFPGDSLYACTASGSTTIGICQNGA